MRVRFLHRLPFRRNEGHLIRKTFLYIVIIPWVFWGIGAGLNQTVEIANGGKFPVQLNQKKWLEHIKKHPEDAGTGMIDDTHCLMTNETHLNYLADIFDLNDNGIYSVGDGFLSIAIYLWSFAPYVWLTLVFVRLIEIKNASTDPIRSITDSLSRD